MTLPQKVYLIDTNVILRYLLSDHQTFSPRAEAFFKKVADDEKRAQIPAVVIMECVYVLEKFYKAPSPEIVDALTQILGLKGIANTDKSEIIRALLCYKDHGADIVDCLLAA
ncbi:MAG: hypothetical protein A2169_10115, partial [Deltaproteobacteria bacterium RBG_13_47_9]